MNFKFVVILLVYRILICFFFCFIQIIVSAQELDDSISDITHFENSLNDDFKLLKSAQRESDSIKFRISSSIESLFYQAIEQEDSWDYPFTNLKDCGKIMPDDKHFRLFNWNIVSSDGVFHYFGVLWIQKENGDKIAYILKDKKNEINDPELQILDYKNWYGSLYYQVVEIKEGRNKYYTLLGWDGNNLLSNKKVIEILRINQSGKPRFGAAIFEMEAKKKKRIIFEYSKKANMTLLYDADLEMIVYDHLAPSNPAFTGNYQFYGPDFSNDGFQFRKGKWKYQPQIDVRNPKVKKDSKESNK
jgi:hypothetical protein